MGNRISTRPKRNTVVVVLVALYAAWSYRRKRIAAIARQRSLSGKTVVVNGVNSGIGHYIAVECAARGATVCVSDCSDEAAQSCAQVIAVREGRAFCFSCDTSDEETLQDKLVVPLRKLVLDKQIAPVEIVIDVNVRPPMDGKIALPLHKLSMDSIKREFDVAAIGHFTVLRAFLADMISSNNGTLAVISSTAAVAGIANQVHFCANQYAARGLTDALRAELVEYGNDGINVFWGCLHLNLIDAVLSDETQSSHKVCPNTRLQQAARKIVEGICSRESALYFPFYLRIIPILRVLLSNRLFNWICAILGLGGGHNHLSAQLEQ